MELQNIEPVTPLLQPTSINSTDGLISVRFWVHKDSCWPMDCCKDRCCTCCYSCREVIENATQIVVPNTTTVGEFLHIVSQQSNKEFTAAFIEGCRLKNEDLIAPTINSFIKFRVPIVVVPKDQCCCLLI